VGSVFAAVGKSAVIDGTNPDTTEAWRYALATLGVTPAAYPAVADADFATVTADGPDGSGTLSQLVDVAELSARRLALDALQDVDQQVDRDSQKWGQLAGRWQKRIDELALYCKVAYGLGADTLEAGTIDLGFQEYWPIGAGPGWW
jgi:hypothetical protein